jgi:hypothetical protein
MRKIGLVLLAAAGVAAVIWKLVSDLKKENQEKAKRNAILEKAREAKQVKALESELQESNDSTQ